MKIRIFRLLFHISASVLAGILLILAFPEHDLSALAWIGLVPLLLIIHNKNKTYSFLLSLLTGIIFIAGIFNWILAVSGYKLYHHAILVFYLALYFSIFGLIFSIISRRWGCTIAFMSAPFIWVSIEYIRSNLFFLALPWALLAHSQHQLATVIQIASITGAYGVSFMIVLVNSTFALNCIYLSNSKGRFRSDDGKLPSRGEITLVSLITASLISLALIYGSAELSKPTTGKSIKVSVLQGDIEQSKKWDRKYAKDIMKTYVDLSMDAAKDKPMLIVWPEAATPGFVLMRSDLKREIVNLIGQTKTNYLIGSSEYPKFGQASVKPGDVGNTAVFFSPEGEVLGQHFKMHLVPFIEQIPYEGHFQWPRFIVPRGKTSWEIQGKEFTLFKIDGTRFGVSICWESLFPDLFRQFVKQGATFMLNISSEAWFGVSAFQYQFLAATKFRAVENRTSIARAGNYTISCFIDPHGRVVKRFPDNMMDGKSFGKGHLTYVMTTSNERPFYTIYGDIFTYIVLAMTALAIIFVFFKKPKIETN